MAGGAADHLAPYRPGRDGPFGWDEAAHLLRRTGFGAPPDEHTRAVERGLEATLDLVFSDPDPGAAEPYAKALDMGERVARRQDLGLLQAQWFLRLLRTPRPLRENLALFWHDHFATAHAKVRDTVALHRQNALFLEHGLAAFPELLAGVARDPAMLQWLDQDRSSKRRPNENFARELLELFSLGRGRYTEIDIREIARAFTGWTVRGGLFAFAGDEHDDGEKTVFGRTGRFGGEDVLELCAGRDECPRFVAGKLLRWFVAPEPTPEQIEAAGAALAAEGGQIGRFLRCLFGSRLFFAESVRRGLIRSPVHLLVGTLRALDARAATRRLADLATGMGQALYDPPSVAGWAGGRSWINSATLIARHNFGVELAEGTEAELRCRPGLDPTTDPGAVAAAIMGERPQPEEIAQWIDRVGRRPAAIAGAALLDPRSQLT